MLIEIFVLVLTSEFTVVIIPQVTVGDSLYACCSIGGGGAEDSGKDVVQEFILAHIHAVEFTQPVLMADVAAAIEVGDLTLSLGGDQIGGKGKAYGLPTLVQILYVSVGSTVGSTLIPHIIICTELVADGCVEVLFVNQIVVAVCNVCAVFQCYKVSLNDCGIGRNSYGAVGAVIGECGFRQIGCQHCKCSRFTLFGIDQQVTSQSVGYETGKTAVIEYRGKESVLVGTIGRTVVIISCKVNGSQIFIDICPVVTALESCMSVKIDLTHGAVSIVARSTVYPVTGQTAHNHPVSRVPNNGLGSFIVCAGAGHNTVSQFLTEVDIIVRIDGGKIVSIVRADIRLCRYRTIGKCEVDITETFLDIHLITVGIIRTARRLSFNAHILSLPVVVAYFCAAGHIQVIVTFVKIVAVQIICNLAVKERL
ncbi:MAG: hypothetical protein BWY95_00935 [Bacteroidetes bacterium ADurb.BinA104]|nr:MAG: hypothetical protein BWY95_00935 [Bacteroidetes bacterium ADurb.BinA104]